MKKEDCIKALRVLKKYSVVSRYTINNVKLYYKIIHPFSQFQGCVYFFIILNSLLDFPYAQIRIENYFKGSFLYNLCVEMEYCNRHKFISNKIFNENMDSLNELYESIVSHIDTLLQTSNVTKSNLKSIN